MTPDALLKYDTPVAIIRWSTPKGCSGMGTTSGIEDLERIIMLHYRRRYTTVAEIDDTPVAWVEQNSEGKWTWSIDMECFNQ